jgi:hypothetical protein
MGKTSRLHREAVIEGREAPFRAITRVCKLCGTTMPEYNARKHIRSCWQYSIGDGQPIPDEPIVYRDGKLMPDWKEFITAKGGAKL